MSKKRVKKLFSSLGLMAILSGSFSALASGPQLFSQSQADTALAQAGSAAMADTAATEYDNPAGMVRLQQPSLTAGTELLSVDYQLRDINFLPHANYQLTTDFPTSASASDRVLIPNFHFVTPMHVGVRPVWFGLGLTVPFGTVSGYENTPFLGVFDDYTSLQIFNLNPNLAIALNDHWSVGIGYDMQYGVFDIDSNYNIPDLSAGGNPGIIYEVNNRLSTPNVGQGWNAGILYQINNQQRIGLAYRSVVHHHFSGSSTGEFLFTPFRFTNTYLDMTFPDTLTASYDWQVTSGWELLATVIYTDWSVLRQLTLHNVGVYDLQNGPFNPGPLKIAQVDVEMPLHLRNTWYGSVGTRYAVTSKLQWSAGIGYDQTPTHDQERPLRVPDANRFILSTGIRYHYRPSLSFDLAYAQLITPEVPVQDTFPINDAVLQPTFNYFSTDIKANSHFSAQMVGVAVNWSF